MKDLRIASSSANTECPVMLIAIYLLAIFFCGLSSSNAGPITHGNLPLLKEVMLSNGSITQCQIITEENRCTPGHEIDKECDYWHGPMKCVPCREGYYQCDYTTSDVNIKCYLPECPELGTETIARVINNTDGTCKLECVCNEAMGYSGPPMDCMLHKTFCGINSELKDGSCVGCEEGFHNPDEKFGRCVPKPTGPTSTSGPSSLNWNQPVKTTDVKPATEVPTTSKPLSGGTPKHQPPGKDLARPARERESSHVNNSGLWIGISIGLVAVLGIAFGLFLIRRGTINIACCSGQNNIHRSEYDQVAPEHSTCNGNLQANMNGIPRSTVDGSSEIQPNSNTTGQEHFEMTIPSDDIMPSDEVVPSVASNSSAAPNCHVNPICISSQSDQSTDQEREAPQTELNIALIYAKSDEELAYGIKEKVSGMVLEGGEKVKVWDFNHPSFGGLKLDFPHKFTSLCRLTLVVLTGHTQDDEECLYMIEQAVSLTRFPRQSESSTYCVRPLHTQSDGNRTYKVPSWLLGIEDFDWTLPGFEDKLRDLLNHLLQEARDCQGR